MKIRSDAGGTGLARMSQAEWPYGHVVLLSTVPKGHITYVTQRKEVSVTMARYQSSQVIILSTANSIVNRSNS